MTGMTATVILLLLAVANAGIASLRWNDPRWPQWTALFVTVAYVLAVPFLVAPQVPAC